MRLLKRGEHGQAAVESALTIPMMLFTMLGIVQLTAVHHGRILAEYAAFKAARAGSVYRADCDRMLKAAQVALVPSIMEPADTYHGEARRLRTSSNLQQVFMRSASYAMTNRTLKGTPMVWLEYKLENTGRDFDKQLEGGEEPMRLRVKLAYFYGMRIPFANWIMARYWLATQTGLAWGMADGSDSTMMMQHANRPMPSGGVDSELVNRARMAMLMKDYVSPIVATWSMRMMSDPTDDALNKNGRRWACK